MSPWSTHLAVVAAATLCMSTAAVAQAPNASMSSASARIAPSDRSATDEVQVRLISASSRVVPGQTVLLALEQRIAPHWHTYWRNPGDSGQPTSIEWKLPTGAQAGDILWPAPKRFDVGPITNYGYEDRALLLTEVRLPQDLTPGGSATLSAEVTWLVCREACIPQQATLTLVLPVAARAMDSSEADTLARARAALPVAVPYPVSARIDGREMTLSWPAQAPGPVDIRQALFLPNDWGRIEHAAKPALTRAGNDWHLRMPVGEQPAQAGQPIEGLLLVDGRAWTVHPTVTGGAATSRAAEISTGRSTSPTGAAMDAGATTHSPTDASTASATSAAAAGVDNLGLWTAMGLALVGGLILNLMPCVFPVLAIKALGFLQGEPREHRRQGLVYTAGVLVAFAALATALLALRAAGSGVGWGFQFQSPIFVLSLAWLMFVLGLSLAGVLEIGAGFAGMGNGLASRPGLSGSFFTGVLATVVATPCTAPFMGAAMAYALAQSPVPLFSVFLSLGLGLALPYLALAWWPALQRGLPRPGRWMEVLKQGLAFPMFAAAIWLVWVLAQQAGPAGVLLALAGMGMLALAAWLRRVSRRASAGWRWTGAGGAVAAVLATASLLPVAASDNLSTDVASPRDPGAMREGGDPAGAAQAEFEPYSPERLAALRAQGKPVFVNLTASWCITCLVNERVALSTADVRDAFVAKGVTYLKGDWTRQDPRITELLRRHQRSGVPLYLFYPAGIGSDAQVLPQLLTPGIVVSALQAGAT
jgi:thiol:disulfide interchange protein DsbD